MQRVRTTGFVGLMALLTTVPTAAVGQGGDGAQYIRKLAGCFEVTYRFVEDGRHDTFARERPLAVHEWIGLRDAGGAELILLHVSITPDGRAVPHWHEVWRREPNGDSWRQEVWSDTPGHPRSELRYQCAAPWRMNLWQCHAGRAPKPFRDSGAPFGFDRPDYEWLERKNTLLVTDRGWVHDEHNKKIDTEGDTVALELGWITYERISETRCRVAIEQYGRQD